MPSCHIRSILTCCRRVEREDRRPEYEPIREEIPRRETPVPDDPTPISSLKVSIKPPSTVSEEAADREWADFDGVYFINEENESSSPTAPLSIKSSTPAAEYSPDFGGGGGEDNTLSSESSHHHVDERNATVPTSQGTDEPNSNPGMCPPAITLLKKWIGSATTPNGPRSSPLFPSHRNRVCETCSEENRHGWREAINNSEILNSQSLEFQGSPQLSPSKLRENHESRAGHTPLGPHLTVQGEIGKESAVHIPVQGNPYASQPSLYIPFEI